jgi:hypothetical protein
MGFVSIDKSIVSKSGTSKVKGKAFGTGPC